jgi:hypothetical protein
MVVHQPCPSPTPTGIARQSIGAGFGARVALVGNLALNRAPNDALAPNDGSAIYVGQRQSSAWIKKAVRRFAC